MNIRVLLPALVAFLLFVSAGWAAEPRIEVERSEYDFGKVFEGEKVHYTFRFRNAGDAPLTVDRVRSSCGCTVPRLSADVLAPGEVAEMETIFDTARFRGMQIKTIYVYTNDPRQDVVQLSLRGMVEQVIETDPARIDFGVIRTGEVKQAVVRLQNRSEVAVQLGEPVLTNSDARAQLSQKTLKAGESVELRVEVTPAQERGRLSGYVLIPTSHPNVAQLRLSIFGTVTP
ncbi:DUF1573 domain-containing protein [Geoalkalibacter halelectricus]|uniref:DUF1573 domain-containing protein n=1 Tax=Geoalkalibacter halelectricus TaxID=2847045 RepID=A0ABY5ZK14_9BACT|nr:DUF1573 domain-containing protein [Geoalkalibacter halelectricus]MDO3380151.1 DUF1573 domain-containing protein [Geoalkalibacter halelectricus]UWZ78275.1 DUF1573 domain-containing protein [Geoalkalibacter halelectricus]